METEMINIPLLKKLEFKLEKQVIIKSDVLCCAPTPDASQCCSTTKSEEEHDGACCAQPEDGSACCNK